MRIKSITGVVHDTGYGGYPYKIVATIEVDVKEFNKQCPIVGKARHTICGYRAPDRDLGHLVREVNNALYKLNSNIPAHSPSIDPKGHKRAVNGVKTLLFEYFMTDVARAKALGFEHHDFKNGTSIVKYGQSVQIYKGDK